VLRTLRDRLPLGLAAHLGSQLPLLIRGVYYDQFEPEKLPLVTRSADDFLGLVNEQLANTRPVDVNDATRATFQILSRHIDFGQMTKVRDALPEEIRALWPADFLEEAPRQGASRAAAGRKR
jgi:uncharacterized protein (DUF2267 family)